MQLRAQQTLPRHTPLLQAAPNGHGCPGGAVAMHALPPPVQKKPDLQLVDVPGVQPVAHDDPLQTKLFAHGCGGPDGLQTPVPVQYHAGVDMPLLQPGGMHSVERP
jgi:hypothetical protein